MSNIKVTPHFNKNGRMTGYGKRSTSNGVRYLSTVPHTLAWMGKLDGDIMLAIIAENLMIGFVRYNESTRNITKTINLTKTGTWDIDVDLRKLIRDKLNLVNEVKYMPHDWVTVYGVNAIVMAEHVRVRINEDEYQNIINVKFEDGIQKDVPLSGLKFVGE